MTFARRNLEADQDTMLMEIHKCGIVVHTAGDMAMQTSYLMAHPVGPIRTAPARDVKKSPVITYWGLRQSLTSAVYVVETAAHVRGESGVNGAGVQGLVVLGNAPEN